MTVTKKAKRVCVFFVETKSYYATYICPSCHVEVVGVNIDKSTVSFKCDCGQILIVEKISYVAKG